MSCIAGVGGDVQSLVETATSGRPIIALDGCPLQCARHCLHRHGVTPTLHYTLSDFGIRKRYHAQFAADSTKKTAEIMAATQRPIVQTALSEPSGEPAWKTSPKIRPPSMSASTPA